MTSVVIEYFSVAVARRAKRKPVYDDDQCPGCAVAEDAGERESLSYVESGGGQEAANDYWAKRVYGG